MNRAIKNLGLVVLAGCVFAGVYEVFWGSPGWREAVEFAIAALFGFGLLAFDRITEIAIPGVATIKAAIAQAEHDADEVARLRDDIKSVHDRLQGEVESIESLLLELKCSLAEVSASAEFLTTANDAQVDSREAYEKLKLWAQDSEHPFHDRARDVLSRIYLSVNGPFIEVPGPPSFKDGIDPASLDLARMTNQIFDVDKHTRRSLIRFVFERKDYPPKERVEFLLKLIVHDPSLRNLICAIHHFNYLTDANIFPLDAEACVDWWRRNHSTFVYAGPFL